MRRLRVGFDLRVAGGLGLVLRCGLPLVRRHTPGGLWPGFGRDAQGQLDTSARRLDPGGGCRRRGGVFGVGAGRGFSRRCGGLGVGRGWLDRRGLGNLGRERYGNGSPRAYRCRWSGYLGAPGRRCRCVHSGRRLGPPGRRRWLRSVRMLRRRRWLRRRRVRSVRGLRRRRWLRPIRRLRRRHRLRRRRGRGLRRIRRLRRRHRLPRRSLQRRRQPRKRRPEIAVRGLHIFMPRPQQRRPEPADPVEVPPCLVPVFQLVRDHRQVVRQPQDLDVALAPAELPRGQRVLQQRPGLRQLTQPAPQAGQDARRVEDHRVVFAQLVPRLVQQRGQGGSSRTGIAGSAGGMSGSCR